MPHKYRPLWQLLLATSNPDHPPTNLTCDDCFAILQYLYDIAQLIQLDHQTLLRLARNHLAACPDCRHQYEQQLDKMAAIWPDKPDAA